MSFISPSLKDLTSSFATNTARELKAIVLDVLREDLGQYTTNAKTIPAVWIYPPSLPSYLKIVPGSGIEAVIMRSPDVKVSGLNNYRSQVTQTWTIALTQYNLSDTTHIATIKLGNYFTYLTTRFRPQMETPQGIEPEQVLLIIKSYHFLRKGIN